MTLKFSEANMAANGAKRRFVCTNIDLITSETRISKKTSSPYYIS